jgi:plasmid maintenance system antidote protein VapI
MATTIGQLIEEEVRRQGWNITEFAEKICCTRPNVYNIFERNRMDVAQLQIISKVLDHNFFMDLAENPELADASNPEVKKDLLNRRAVAQFFDAMPTVLRKLHIETNIVMPIMQLEEGIPLPDYGLSDYAIFFTVGERLLDRFTPTNSECFEVQTEVAYKNHIVDIWHNLVHHSWFADVKLDYKTEEEWGEIIVYLLDSWGIPLKIRNYDNGKA